MKKLNLISVLIAGLVFASTASGETLYMVKETRSGGAVVYYGGAYGSQYAGKPMPRVEADRVAYNVRGVSRSSLVEVLVWDGRALRVWQSTR